MSAPRRVLMVCMGNICRSPTAEGVLRRKLEQAGLGSTIVVDSAGTHDYHAGDPPDRRAVLHAERRGYDLSALRARKVDDSDFQSFDLILAMDSENARLLEGQCPDEQRPKLRRLTEFATRHRVSHVPDPYYGSPAGFDRVLDIVEDACEGLVAYLVEAHAADNGASNDRDAGAGTS